MGRDYRHLTKYREMQLDNDGFHIDKKLEQYDRNKNRKKNKINLNKETIKRKEELDIENEQEFLSVNYSDDIWDGEDE